MAPLFAGIVIGAAAINSLHAQSKGRGAYAIIDLGQITDRDSFTKQLLPKEEPAILGADARSIGGLRIFQREHALELA
jgi:hypothetical protein